MTYPRLHLDADTSSITLCTALRSHWHDVTRTPSYWMPADASPERQLLGATAQGRCLFTFSVTQLPRLALHYPAHGGVALAAQSSWTLDGLIEALDRMLSETRAEDWTGQVRWLDRWRC